MKNYSLLCGFLFSLSHCQGKCSEHNELIQGYLHPNVGFDRVQAICNTIWRDLDIFLVEQIHPDASNKLPEIEKNIGCLWCAVQKLIMHDECSNYIVDDIRYLKRMIELVSYKYLLAQEKVRTLNEEISFEHVELFAMICLFLQQLAAASYEVVA